MSMPTATLDALFDADFATTLGADGPNDRADWLIDKEVLIHAPEADTEESALG